jgi:hypothetical protein
LKSGAIKVQDIISHIQQNPELTRSKQTSEDDVGPERAIRDSHNSIHDYLLSVSKPIIHHQGFTHPITKQYITPIDPKHPVIQHYLGSEDGTIPPKVSSEETSEFHRSLQRNKMTLPSSMLEKRLKDPTTDSGELIRLATSTMDPNIHNIAYDRIKAKDPTKFHWTVAPLIKFSNSGELLKKSYEDTLNLVKNNHVLIPEDNIKIYNIHSHIAGNPNTPDDVLYHMATNNSQAGSDPKADKFSYKENENKFQVGHNHSNHIGILAAKTLLSKIEKQSGLPERTKGEHGYR